MLDARDAIAGWFILSLISFGREEAGEFALEILK